MTFYYLFAYKIYSVSKIVKKKTNFLGLDNNQSTSSTFKKIILIKMVEASLDVEKRISSLKASSKKR